MKTHHYPDEYVPSFEETLPFAQAALAQNYSYMRDGLQRWPSHARPAFDRAGLGRFAIARGDPEALQTRVTQSITSDDLLVEVIECLPGRVQVLLPSVPVEDGPLPPLAPPYDTPACQEALSRDPTPSSTFPLPTYSDPTNKAEVREAAQRAMMHPMGRPIYDPKVTFEI